MVDMRRVRGVRASVPSDDDFFYDVFCTTWASEVAALPNQNLARHVLRIQHTAQERRFAGRFPAQQRFVVELDGASVGRLYVSDRSARIQIVDLTLLPEFQGRGTEARVVRGLMTEAAREEQVVGLQVSRRDDDASALYAGLGFELVSVDDLDNTFEWTPATVAVPPTPRRTDESGAMAMRGERRTS
jgi:ribosomal protein S18 acetylase RimI-like enzyme